jgi:hypothetical protein
LHTIKSWVTRERWCDERAELAATSDVELNKTIADFLAEARLLTVDVAVECLKRYKHGLSNEMDKTVLSTFVRLHTPKQEATQGTHIIAEMRFPEFQNDPPADTTPL